MLGWINDCIEKLVIEKFGIDAWHIIKQKAGCEVPDGGFFKLDAYTDKSSVDLVVAASEVAELTVEEVLEMFGAYFVHYIRGEGYDNLLCCQGSTLKDWLANINAIHQHLQTTFPKKMIMPQFWVEDNTESGDGSLLVHYHSKRGNLLAPIGKGLIMEIAEFQFGVEVDMQIIRLQNVDDAKYTSWKLSAVNPEDQWKLAKKVGERDGKKNAPTSFKCPFTGMTATMPRRGSAANSVASSSSVYAEDDQDLGESSEPAPRPPLGCPMSSHSKKAGKSSLDNSSPELSLKKTYGMVASNASATSGTEECSSEFDNSWCSGESDEIGLSGGVTKALFPYHVIVNSEFTICQVGRDLPGVLKAAEEDIVGRHVAEVLNLTKPIGVNWDWEWLRMLEDQSFDVEPVEEPVDASLVRFKASVVHVSDQPPLTMIMMNPDANNLEDLREMNLTLSDLPVHGAHRDAIFLREHLSTQMNNALKMEKLSRSLTREKQLLESLLPEHAAAGLRAGKTVEPMLHNNVTFFFSDIVGFTTICERIYPWDVINMLNKLYGAMDFLAGRFNLFKVETIGDAYVCCSGLPQADEDHAKNVANFAIAVNHCCRQILSPLDDAPIQLRIGIHSGSCASGVVGMTNPRYCVFGDTVNTTARHESTGAPGKIHCSSDTQMELDIVAPRDFLLEERGYVDMKGKGELVTYWLEASESNELANKKALEELEEEVRELLTRNNFDNKVGPQNVAKKRDSLIKQLHKETDARHLMAETVKADSLKNALRFGNDSFDSLTEAEEEDKIFPVNKTSQSGSSITDTLDEAVALPNLHSSHSSLGMSATDISLNFDAGEELELLKQGYGLASQEEEEEKCAMDSFSDAFKKGTNGKALPGSCRVNVEVNPILSNLATGAGKSQEYEYFYFM